MTNEIKTSQDILDYINDRVIPNEYWDKVLDYITNLQEENERLKNELDNVKASYETEAEAKYYEYIDKHESKLQEKIDKAIEKLESIRVFGLRSGKTLFSTLINESIDILQGEDK